MGAGAVRIVRGTASARLVFSLPVPEKRRERLAVNARLDATAKPSLMPSKDGKPASIKINLTVADSKGEIKLSSYIFRVRTDAQAQALIDSIVRVTASLAAAPSS